MAAETITEPLILEKQPPAGVPEPVAAPKQDPETIVKPASSGTDLWDTVKAYREKMAKDITADAEKYRAMMAGEPMAGKEDSSSAPKKDISSAKLGHDPTDKPLTVNAPAEFVPDNEAEPKCAGAAFTSGPSESESL